MDKQKRQSIIYALMAAIFYAVNVPVSKILLQKVGPTTMASLLYLGAGIGIGVLSFFNKKDQRMSERLSRKDLPYVIGMIVLDIAAPIFLMLGINHGTSANASLLGNFEIVATTVIALFVFKEAVSTRLWAAIVLITMSSILLSFDAQNVLGAAKTSAYYAVAPFVGVFLSFVFLKEQLTWIYLIALLIMVAGSILVVMDTLIHHHAHFHQHTFTHVHDGTVHRHTVTHSHEHNHYATDSNHHHHPNKSLEGLPGAMHQ